MAPEHLRPATDLEEHSELLGGRSASGLGESILNMPNGLLPGSYVDLIGQDGPNQEQLERAEHYTPEDWSSVPPEEQGPGDPEDEPRAKRGRILDVPDSEVPQFTSEPIVQFVPDDVLRFAPPVATPPTTPRRVAAPLLTTATGSGSAPKRAREESVSEQVPPGLSAPEPGMAVPL